MSFTIIHEPGRMLRISYHDSPLLHYVYVPDVPGLESPRPYIHPLYSLNGHLVTDFRPADHPWHHGLSMTLAYLSGENFWGGPTYLREAGYQQLANNGQQIHQRWLSIQQDELTASWEHQLLWQSAKKQDLLHETRRIRIDLIHHSEGYWCLTWHSQFENVSGQPLELGSPGTQGRAKGGYGSLFWRGPQSFRAGQILLAGGGRSSDDDESLMGAKAAWLAYINHPSSEHRSSLIFVDQPGNPRYPNPWFLRAGSTPMVCFALHYEDVYMLDPGEIVTLEYQVIIADGNWDASLIETALNTLNNHFQQRKEDLND